MRPLVLLVTGLLLATGFAGCLNATKQPTPSTGATTSEKRFDKILKEHTPFKADDGVTLDAWTFRPDTNESVPVLIEPSPYFGNLDPTIESGGQAFSKWLVSEFVPRGYAVVLTSVRGTGLSEGCFSMGGTREGQDEAEIVEHFATEKWSSGKAAIIGKSYRGTVPQQVAALAPAHLTTIVPIEGITDWYAYLFTNGAARFPDGGTFNAAYDMEVGKGVGVPPSQDEVQGSGFPTSYPGKFCQDTIDLWSQGVASTGSGDKTAFWDERDYAKDVSKLKASVFLIHGLQDWNVKPDQVVDWFNAVPTAKKLLLGQWDHQYPNRVDWADELLRWFDWTLKGVPNGIDREPIVQVKDNQGIWRVANEWPPTHPTLVDFPLSTGGALGTTPGDAKTGAASFATDVSKQPNATQDGAWQIKFTSDALASDLRFAGTPRLFVNASLDRPYGQLIGVLYDIAPDGSAREIVHGILDARHRTGNAQGSAPTPAELDPYVLRFYPCDVDLLAGHKLQLVLAGADTNWVQPPPPGATMTFKLGPDANLQLPSVTSVTLESPQPVEKKATEFPYVQQ
ncbi:MAG: CocE/NonD family hydrolase [Thermoplasmatota archaeon]